MKRLSVAGEDYGPDEVNELRAQLVQLRDSALNNGHMEWAVMLSHVIGLLAAFGLELWGEEYKP